MEKKDWKQRLGSYDSWAMNESMFITIDGETIYTLDELLDFIQQELDKAREEGVKEYIDLLQGIEHYEGLKMVRGLVGLDKHEKRDYYNLQRRFEELSKLDNK